MSIQQFMLVSTSTLTRVCIFHDICLCLSGSIRPGRAQSYRCLVFCGLDLFSMTPLNKLPWLFVISDRICDWHSASWPIRHQHRVWYVCVCSTTKEAPGFSGSQCFAISGDLFFLKITMQCLWLSSSCSTYQPQHVCISFVFARNLSAVCVFVSDEIFLFITEIPRGAQRTQ